MKKDVSVDYELKQKCKMFLRDIVSIYRSAPIEEDSARVFWRRGARVRSGMISEKAYNHLLVELGKDRAMEGEPIEEIECVLRNRGKTASFHMLIHTLSRRNDEYREKVMGDIWRCGLIEVGRVLDPDEKFKVAIEVGVKELKFVICSDVNCARCQILTLAEGLVCGPLQD